MAEADPGRATGLNEEDVLAVKENMNKKAELQRKRVLRLQNISYMPDTTRRLPISVVQEHIDDKFYIKFLPRNSHEDIIQTFRKTYDSGLSDDSVEYAEPVFGFLSTSFELPLDVLHLPQMRHKFWEWIMSQQDIAKSTQALEFPNLKQMIWPVEFCAAMDCAHVFSRIQIYLPRQAVVYFLGGMRQPEYRLQTFKYYFENHALENLPHIKLSQFNLSQAYTDRITKGYALRNEFHFVLSIPLVNRAHEMLDTLRAAAIENPTSMDNWHCIMCLHRLAVVDTNPVFDSLRMRFIAMFRSMEGADSVGKRATLYMNQHLYDILATTKDRSIYRAVLSHMTLYVLEPNETAECINLLIGECNLPIGRASANHSNEEKKSTRRSRKMENPGMAAYRHYQDKYRSSEKKKPRRVK